MEAMLQLLLSAIWGMIIILARRRYSPALVPASVPHLPCRRSRA